MPGEIQPLKMNGWWITKTYVEIEDKIFVETCPIKIFLLFYVSQNRLNFFTCSNGVSAFSPIIMVSDGALEPLIFFGQGWPIIVKGNCSRPIARESTKEIGTIAGYRKTWSVRVCGDLKEFVISASLAFFLHNSLPVILNSSPIL